MPTKTSKAKKPDTNYVNNPFFVAANGITLLFNLAVGVAVVMVMLSFLSFVINGWTSDTSTSDSEVEQALTSWQSTVNGWTANEWTLVIGSAVIIGLAFMMISSLLGGISSYTSYRLSRGERVAVSDAFREAFDRLWSFLWLQILIVVKIFLWSILFIIPGIIMAFRYTLAGVAFFDENKNLRGNAAIKESLRLTKGAWITTFASNMLFNFLTFGFFGSVISTGVNAILYQQFGDLKDKPKPAAHWLSWLTLALPFIIFVFAFTLLIGMVIGIAFGSPTVVAPKA